MKTHPKARIQKEHEYLLRSLVRLHAWLRARCLKGERVWPSEVLERLNRILGGL